MGALGNLIPLIIVLCVVGVATYMGYQVSLSYVHSLYAFTSVIICYIYCDSAMTIADYSHRSTSGPMISRRAA